MPAARAGRRRFVRGAVLGSLVAFALDALLLLGGDADLLPSSGPLGGFFDAQARAFLDGRLAVDPEAVGFEGIVVDGGTFLYYGPVLALLRLPVLAVTNGLDGRLTVVSMLLAFAVLLAAGAWLHWRVRELARPGAAVERGDAASAFLVQLALGAGAVPLYLASRAVVYHETELWAAAFSVAGIAAIVAVLERPSRRRIAVAGALALLALNTRFSVGLGPVLALLAVAAAAAAGGRWRRLAALGPRALGSGGEPRARAVTLLVAAALVPVALSAAISQVKFGQPFGIPLDKQVYSSLDPNRRATLAANGGSLFGPKFVPTTLLQAVRPDAVGRTRAFPFVGLPRDRPRVVGDVRFDTIEHSLSAPTSMPLFCLLALAGLLASARRERLRPLLGVLAGTAAGGATTLTIAYVTTRYLADLLPFLLLAALAGLQVLLEATRPELRGGRRRARRALLGVAAVLTLAGAVVNGSTGVVTQRLLSAETPEAQRAAFVRAQDDVDRWLGRTPRGFDVGTDLPPPGVPGDLFALEGCAGLYVAGERMWLPVERTARSGVRRFTVRPSRRAPRAPEAIVAIGEGERRVTVARSRDQGLALRVGGRIVDRGGRLPAGRARDVRISFDRSVVGFDVTVGVEGRPAVSGPAPYDRRAPIELGRFSGTVRPAASPAPETCRALLGRARPRDRSLAPR